MERSFDLKKTAGLIVMITVLVSVGLFFLSVYQYNRINEQSVTLSEGWKLSVDGQVSEDVDLDRFAFDHTLKKGEVIELWNTVPENIKRFSMLRLQSYLSAFQLYIGDDLVYEYGMDLLEQGEFIGSGYFIIPIPQGKVNETLYLRFVAGEHGAMSNIIAPVFYPAENAYEILFGENLLSGFCAIFLFIFGLILTVMSLAVFLRGKMVHALTCLGIFSMLIGVWSMANMKLMSLYSSNYTFNTRVEYLCLYYSLVPLAIFIGEMKSGSAKWKKRLIRIVVIVDLTFAVFATIVHYAGLIHFPELLVAFHMLALLSAVAVFAVVREKRGNRSRQDKVLGTAFVEILLVGVLDVLRFRIQISLLPDAKILYRSILPFGTLFFFILLVISYLYMLYERIMSDAEKETLTRLAYRDSMTGLYNRQMSEKVFKEYDESSEDFVLVNLDVNGLKKVNDTYGHEMGDKMLCDFAGLLAECFQDKGVVARMGGDEFLVATKAYTAEETDKRLQELLQAAEQLSKERTYPISAAYGVVARKDYPDRTCEQLYKRADELMYEMKVRTKQARKD